MERDCNLTLLKTSIEGSLVIFYFFGQQEDVSR